MARDNPTWGQSRMTNELLRKLGLRVSPRTVHRYVPKGLDLGPGNRVPSQRWRTFLLNHAHALIVNGVSGVQTWSLRIRRRLPWWRGHPIASEGPGSSQTDAICLSLLHETVSVPTAGSPDTVDVISVDERGPPNGRPPCTHDPSTTVRATPADTCDPHRAIAALCWWNGASPHAWSAEPLSKDGIQVIPWRRAA
jgi:hypothetical protein